MGEGSYVAFYNFEAVNHKSKSNLQFCETLFSFTIK